MRLLAAILLLVLVFYLALLIIRDNSGVRHLTPLVVLFVAWFVFFLRVAPWWKARNQFRKQPSAHGQITMVLDEAGVHLRWDGSTSDLAWKNYIRWVEGKNQFLLYQSPALFNMVPKRALTPEQIVEFRVMLAEHIGSGKG
jgi:hypothetical protein